MDSSVIDWNNFSIDTVISGKADNGKRYLELFLIDYKNLFNENPNAGCNKCISEYLRKYKLKNSNMATSNYKLKAKYEGISLGENTSVMVNNRNLTDAYAKILLKTHKAEDLFDLYPKAKTAAEKKAEADVKAETERIAKEEADAKAKDDAEAEEDEKKTIEPTQEEIDEIDTLGEIETAEKQD